jgi:hypothetical protein
VHSQRFVDVLEKRAKEAGANLIIKAGRESLMQFLTGKLNAKNDSDVFADNYVFCAWFGPKNLPLNL